MMIVDKGPIVRDLLEIGRKVAVIRGKLLIYPPLPAGVFKESLESMAAEIVTVCNKDGFLYESYTTGRYGRHKAAGINLQFLSLRNGGTPAYTIFNVELHRARKSKHGVAGSPLPGKQFRINRKHKFYGFWLNAGLQPPPRMGSFHDYMGNLQQIIFTGKLSRGQRINKDTLRPLSMIYEELLDNFGIQVPYRPPTACGQPPHKFQTIPGQPPDNPPTGATYKEMPVVQGCRATEQDPATGIQYHRTTQLREYGKEDIQSYGDLDTRDQSDDPDLPF